MPKGIPGYPSNKQLQAQALALARAGVPTKKSINRQYGRGIQDTEAFTQALLAKLGSISSGIGGAYSQAVGDQQSIDAAARARLSALGGEYGAGSAAAVGGMGDSALSHLVANRAAAQNYGAQLPAAAAARGLLGVHSLETARSDALRQRGEDLRSQYVQTLNQVQNQALARSQLLSSNQNAALDRQLQRQGMKQSQAQFAATQAFNQQQANAEQQRWAYEHSPQWLKIQAQIQAAASGSGGAGPLAGYTQGQINTMMSKGFTSADNFAGGGTPIGKAIDQMVAQGIARPIAVSEAANAYKNLNRPRFQDFNDGRDNPRRDYNQAIAAYHTAWNSFKRFSRMKSFNKWLKKQPHYQPTPPGAHGPGK